MTVSDLKDELKKRSLETKGLKKDLVQRLTEALGASAAGGEKMEEEEPKKKAAPARGGKRKAAKEEDEDEDEEEEPKGKKGKEEEVPAKKSKVLAAAAELTAKKKTGKAKVDDHVPLNNAEVYADGENVYDAKLNQTNIGQNNNKYYFIQLLKAGSNYYVWNRWGRVGERGQNALKPFNGSLPGAIKEFEKKFKEKSANAWAARANFVPKTGKYTLLEIDYDDDDEEEINSALASVSKATGGPAKPAKVRPCSLPKATQDLIKVIFDNDMFKETLTSYKIDVKKMPLGKISKAGLAKGFEVLEEIEEELKKPKPSNATLSTLSSRFYTLIPHEFGRAVPPAISDKEHLQNKMDLLEVLGDIAFAQQLLNKNKGGEEAEEVTEVDHPYDVNYKKLKNEINPIDKNSDDYKLIDTFLTNSRPDLKLMEVFEVDREGEKARFATHKDLDNRKLLWHGTNVAVIVAILSSGLRIMPHSGGRVGRGLYFASECAKSASYVRTTNDRVGFMFLNEIALGKPHIITQDDSSLRVAPKGFDSIIARGRVEPDPSKDQVIRREFGDITVPVGKAINQPQYANSSFFNSEYLVYSESQVYTRYLLKIHW